MAASQDSATVEKVTVSLKPAGNAPTLNKSKFLVEGNRTVGWMHQWLRKNLKCEENESMFVYVAQAFAPSLDVRLDTLYQASWYSALQDGWQLEELQKYYSLYSMNSVMELGAD